MRSWTSASQPHCRCSALRLRRHEIGGQLRTLAEEVAVHLLDQKFLCLCGAEVEPILIHEHLHVLHPHFPRVLGDTLVDFLSKRVAFERDFVQAFQLLLKLHAKHLARAGTNGVRDLAESTTAVSATHTFRILLYEPESQ